MIFGKAKTKLKILLRTTDEQENLWHDERRQTHARVDEIKYSGTGIPQKRKLVDDHEANLTAAAAKLERTVHLGEYGIPHPTMSDVVYEPAGVVAVITGYNYPLNLLWLVLVSFGTRRSSQRQG